jgi:hypothetical protein
VALFLQRAGGSGHGGQLHIGLANIELHFSWKTEYFKIPLPSSMRYEREWFFDRDVAGSAPPFTGWEPVSMEEWHHGAEASLKSEVEHLLAAIQMLKQRGLNGAQLVHTPLCIARFSL